MNPNLIIMKKFVLLLAVALPLSIAAQTKTELTKHYEAFYAQMKAQGDVQGVINALTHLNVLQPSQGRLDTLAYVYMTEGRYIQALNTIGIDPVVADSDIALEVKAVSLKALNENERALPHFNELFKRSQNPAVAYELAELNLMLNNIPEANKHVTYGIANSKEEEFQTYYETQQPYQVPLKAAFYYLKGLVKYNEDKAANADTAMGFMDQALQMAPNFNLAAVSKQAIEGQKKAAAGATKPGN